MEDIIRDPDDPDDPDAWMWLFDDEADEDASRDATKKAQKWFFFFFAFLRLFVNNAFSFPTQR